MKRIIAWLLLSALLLTGCAAGDLTQTETAGPETMSGETVTQKEEKKMPKGMVPTERPNFTFDHEPTVDELRGMAIEAMRADLSFHWSPAKTLMYNKTGAHSDKDFIFEAGVLFGGLPYTNAGGGIFQMMEYIDPETGVFDGIDPQSINSMFGNTCAEGVEWGWRAVAGKVNAVPTYTMLIANGFLPVGEYKYDHSITDYRNDGCGSPLICQQNGEQVMYRSYAALLPADGVVSSGENSVTHAMMVIEKPTVVYKADGTIDGKASTVVVQDQRTGGRPTNKHGFPVQEDGATYYYSGRTSATETFESLLGSGYLPVTIPLFTGEEKYEPSSVTLSETAADYHALKTSGAVITSNFTICVVRAELKDEAGNVVSTRSRTTSSSNIKDGTAYEYPAVDLPMPSGKSGTVTLTVVTADGADHVLGEFPLGSR